MFFILQKNEQNKIHIKGLPPALTEKQLNQIPIYLLPVKTSFCLFPIKLVIKMNTLLVLFAVIFAIIIITESFEFDERSLQLNDDDDEIISYKPKLQHKLRRKRDDSKKTHLCGVKLSQKISEVCNSCSRNPNTNAIKRKRDLSPFLEQKIRTKREKGFSTYCCKNGCTKAELRAVCC